MSQSFLRRLAKSVVGSRFVQERKAGAAVMFALVSPVALLALAGVASYAYALQYRADVQSAIDGAVVAATQELAINPKANIQAIAQSYFQANAPASALGNANQTLSVYSGDFNNAVTVKGEYSGFTPTLLGGMLGFSQMPVGVSAQAQVMLGSAQNGGGSNNPGGGGGGSGGNGGGTSSGGGSGGGSGGSSGGGVSSGGTSSGGGGIGGAVACPGSLCFSGSGFIFGDPHIMTATGDTFNLTCSTIPGAWYNMLSDAGIELNVSCLHTTANGGADYINAFNLLLNGHTIYLNAPPATYVASSNSIVLNPATAWYGGVTIDGIYYPPGNNCTASSPCSTTYLNGLVTVTVQDTANLYRSDNWVYVYYKGYTLAMSFDEAAAGELAIIAFNVGAEGPPGGVWGQTLAGLEDANGTDFVVKGANGNAYPASTSLAGANSVTYQYLWTWPANGGSNVVGNSTTTHLVQ